MKKFKIFTCVLLMFLLVSPLLPHGAYALPDPSPRARIVLLIDHNTGNTLFALNENIRAYPASLTKVMTVLLALEAIERGDISLTDMVEASPYIGFDLISAGATAGIQTGEILSLEDLLYAAMLVSANEATNIIAEHIAGTVPLFVRHMNERAEELGMTGTNFANTHGLPNHYNFTTARDMAIMTKAAMTRPLFAEISSTVTWTIPATNMSEPRVLSNTNELINRHSQPFPGYYFEGVTGVKTGFTSAAGLCLISTIDRGAMSLMCIVMGADMVEWEGRMARGNFTETIRMYEWAFANFSYHEILNTLSRVASVPVLMGSDANHVTLRPETSIMALLPNDQGIDGFEKRIRIFSEEAGEPLVAPIAIGEVLGEVIMERDGVVYGSARLVAVTPVELSFALYIRTQVSRVLLNPIAILAIIGILVLLAAYIRHLLIYYISRKKYYESLEKRRKVEEFNAAQSATAAAVKPKRTPYDQNEENTS